MSFCPLCRVDNTEEHQQSGYHMFNAQLFAQSKMPISFESYEKFEKARQEGTSNGSQTAQDNNHNHNIKSWHFSQINMTSWFLNRLQIALKDQLNYPHPQNPLSIIAIRCSDVQGEAAIRTRKNKIIAAILADLRLEMKCRINDTTVISAKNILVSDVSSDDFDDVTLTAIKFESNDGSQYQADISKILKTEVKKDLIKILTQIYKEMDHWVKNPQSDVPSPLPYSPDWPSDVQQQQQQPDDSSPLTTETTPQTTNDDQIDTQTATDQ